MNLKKKLLVPPFPFVKRKIAVNVWFLKVEYFDLQQVDQLERSTLSLQIVDHVKLTNKRSILGVSLALQPLIFSYLLSILFL